MKIIDIAYPDLAMAFGPIIFEDRILEIEQLSGVLLDYAAAIVAPLSSKITVHFHPSLKQITDIYINNSELWEPMNNKSQLIQFNITDDMDVKNNNKSLRDAIKKIYGEKISLTFPVFTK